MALLQKGDEIGLIASSNPITKKLQNSLNSALSFFQKLGLKPVLGNNIHATRDLKTVIEPKLRAEDFDHFVDLDNIKAVINLWGGYHSIDMLEFIDWNNIKRNPKPIMGASDFTVLLNAIFFKTNIVTYHWINAIWLGLKRYDKSKQTFENHFFKEKQNIASISKIEVISEGKGRGYLIGGNLESFQNLICRNNIQFSTNYVLLVEDTNKSLSNVVKSLSSLINNGFINNCSGIILGNMDQCRSVKKNNLNKQVRNYLLNTIIKQLRIPEIGRASCRERV